MNFQAEAGDLLPTDERRKANSERGHGVGTGGRQWPAGRGRVRTRRCGRRASEGQDLARLDPAHRQEVRRAAPDPRDVDDHHLHLAAGVWRAAHSPDLSAGAARPGEGAAADGPLSAGVDPLQRVDDAARLRARHGARHRHRRFDGLQQEYARAVRRNSGLPSPGTGARADPALHPLVRHRQGPPDSR